MHVQSRYKHRLSRVLTEYARRIHKMNDIASETTTMKIIPSCSWLHLSSVLRRMFSDALSSCTGPA